MTSDNYELQNILHYSRKSYKNRNGTSMEAFSSGRREDVDQDLQNSHESNRIKLESAGCSCDMDADGEIASILHKKCPVIALAQQQLQKILDETDKILYENSRCCRSINDFFLFCKNVLWSQNKCQYVLISIIIFAFIIGILFGAASCGTNLRKFNSPILTCIDNYFISNTNYPNPEESFRAIV